MQMQTVVNITQTELTNEEHWCLEAAYKGEKYGGAINRNRKVNH